MRHMVIPATVPPCKCPGCAFYACRHAFAVYWDGQLWATYSYWPMAQAVVARLYRENDWSEV